MFGIRSFGAVIAAALIAIAAPAGAATVVNGSFERPGTFSGNFQTLGAGNTTLTGWTIVSGNLDLINRYWQNSDGNYSLDMSGNRAATISQTLTGLQVGQKYLVSFDMAGNPDRAARTVRLDATVGTFGGTYSFDTTGKSRANMGWEGRSFHFIANASVATLTFRSLENNAWGPALDNVSVSAVPLPAGGVLLISGLAALAVARRRKRH